MCVLACTKIQYTRCTMSDNNGKNIFEVAELLIKSSEISVCVSEHSKMYMITTPDEQNFYFEIRYSLDGKHTDLIFSSDSGTILGMVLTQNRRIYTPDQENLIKLFQLVVSKLAWQETQTMMRLEMGRLVRDNLKN